MINLHYWLVRKIGGVINGLERINLQGRIGQYLNEDQLLSILQFSPFLPHTQLWLESLSNLEIDDYHLTTSGEISYEPKLVV